MTSPYLLAGETDADNPGAIVRPQIPTLVLESMDGSVKIRLDNSEGFIRMPGSTGLEVPPVEVVSQAIPGVPGSTVIDVRTNERPVFVPIYIGGNGDMLAFREMLDKLYALIDPIGKRTFRLVGESYRGTRELVVTYLGGLEGADDAAASGLSWAKVGLNLVAHEAYAQAREDRTLEFRYVATSAPFLGVVGGTDAPWPRKLSSTTVIGAGMLVNINSEVPVYPTVELVGPMSSFHGDLTPTDDDPDETWTVDIPAGVGSGATMKIVTDPRRKSFRYDGALAASRVTIGSKLGPFNPGENELNVAAPGTTEASLIRLSWRELYRSLW